MKNDTKMFDQRTVRKSIENGVTKEEDYKKYLKALPDESNAAEEVPYEDENDLDIPLDISDEGSEDETKEEA